ncbi:hypothetical protein IMZ48_45570, partial [Candidatus Bathyarchaeota archaeon]|nr:hypothetical protein [Candidatus Bathyarchaeota archaeon]
PQDDTFASLKEVSGDSKLIALSEVGNIPELVGGTETQWAYWVVWGGDFIRGDENNPLQLKKDVYASENTLNRDDIVGWSG